MRVILIGATGTIGRAVAQALSVRHEVVRVGNKGGDFQVDIASPASIQKLYASVRKCDAIVSAAGNAAFGPLEKLTDEQFRLGLDNKLMGQVNLVRFGIASLRDQGSFTLTAGILSREPMPGGSALSLVNGALEAFVKAAALDLPRGLRINVVSPPWVKETMEAMKMDSSSGMPAARVSAAYVASVEGKQTGETLDARRF
jgi:NAD(P)-dependent dehydrogenase (short-subunit alcohol dehydrogenase family)